MRKFIVLAASLVLYVSSAYAAKPVLAVAEFRNETHASWWRTDVGTDLASMLTNELAATENHPAWTHMYLMLMSAQVGFALGYVV